MRLSSAFALVTAFTATTTSAYRAPFKAKHRTSSGLTRRAPQSPNGQVNVNGKDDVDNSFDIVSSEDMVYLAEMTVAGKDYMVQLDTGSSDLFIKGESYPLPNATPTDIAHNLTYAVGWAAGTLAYASVDFVGITIPNQAFVDANAADNPALGLGAQGVVGLGFTRLSSIDRKLNNSNEATGRSLLYNLFAANPEQPNFLAFVLHRESNKDDEVEGSFAIGEFEPEYMQITTTASIPTFPRHDPSRWNVLLDAIIINPANSTNSTIIPGFTALPNAPNNKAVVLLDSGASYTYAPPEICEAIYGGIPGAKLQGNYWSVPCSTEVNVALQIGGQVFPFHPLDLVKPRKVPAGTCMGTFIPQILDAKWGFDWLIGDNFLRSVYSVYDFGDFDSAGKMGDPYVKLLSIVDPDEASIDYHLARGGSPKKNITYTGLDGVSIAPSFSISTDISESLDMIGKYMPAMLAVVGFNALILIVGVIVWLVMLIRRRRRRSTARVPRARTGASSRAESNRADSLRPNSYIAGMMSPQAHSYEPVSMALTEDTFIPPSPAFLSPGKMQSGDRPKSVA